MSLAPRGGGRGGSRGAPRGRGRGGLRSGDSSDGEGSARSFAKHVRFDSSAGSTRGDRGTPRGPRATTARGDRARGARSRPFRGQSGPQPARTSTPALNSGGNPADRFQALKYARDQERALAIQNGFLADPDNPRPLSEAITPVGTCEDMCPEFERVERIVQKDVWTPEMAPDTVDLGYGNQVPDESRMIKKFRRSAAGLEEQLPSDLRPPLVLQKTINYLFDEIVDKSQSLASVHNFIWDRTRAIRNDFSIQQVTKVFDIRIAMDCFERIARFHILSLHQMSLPGRAGTSYSYQQDKQQLDKTLYSLMQYYEDWKALYRSPNEPEFRAYCVIMAIQSYDPYLEDRVQKWPSEVLNDVRLKSALKLYAAAGDVLDRKGPLKPPKPHELAQENWQRFWAIVDSSEISYLMGCCAEMVFNNVRRTALHSIWVAFRQGSKIKLQDWTSEALMEVLGLDNESEVIDFCEHYGLSFADTDDGRTYLDLGSISSWPDSSPGLASQIFSDSLVERKRCGRTLRSVLFGIPVAAARRSGFILSDEELQENSKDSGSLFVTGESSDEDEPQDAQRIQPASKPIINGMSSSFGTPKPSPFNPSASSFAPKQPSTAIQPTSRPNPFASGVSAPAPPSAVSNPFAPSRSAPPAVSYNPFNKTPASTPPTSFAPSSFSTLYQEITAPSTDVSSKPSFSLGGNIASLPNQTSSNPFNPTTTSSPFVSQPSATGGFPTSTLFNSNNGKPPDNKKEDVKQPTAGFSFSTLTSQPLASPSPPTSFSGFSATSQPLQPPQIAVTPPPQATAQASTTAPSTAPSAKLNPFGFPIQPTPPKPEPSASTSAPPSFSFPGQTTSASSSVPSTAASGTKPNFPLPAFETRTQQPRDRQQESSATTSSQQQTSTQPRRQASFIPPTSPRSAESPASFTPPPPPPVRPAPPQAPRQSQADRKARYLHKAAEDLFLDPEKGLLYQMIEYTASEIAAKAIKDLNAERAREKADTFRFRSLAARYGRLWRELAHLLRLKRQGRERRKRVQAEREARAKDKVEMEKTGVGGQLEYFKRSRREERNGAELAKKSEGKRKVVNQEIWPDDLVVDEPFTMEQMAAMQERSTRDLARPARRTPIRALHRRSRTQPTNTVANATPQNSTYRISKPSSAPKQSTSSKSQQLAHTMLAASAEPFSDSLFGNAVVPPNTRLSTTKTNYFRLKAMGVPTDDESDDDRSARKVSGKKRLRDEETTQAQAATATEISPPNTKRRHPYNQRDPTQPSSVQNKSPKDTVAEDEALFARLRKVREAMDDSITFYREETANLQEEERRRSRSSSAEFRRSGGSNQGANTSFGMISAPGVQQQPYRPFGASQGAYGASPGARGSAAPSGSGSQISPPRSLPKFWGRESFFVKREDYGKSKAQREQEKRGREDDEKRQKEREELEKKQKAKAEATQKSAFGAGGKSMGKAPAGQWLGKGWTPFSGGFGHSTFGQTQSQSSFGGLGNPRFGPSPFGQKPSTNGLTNGDASPVEEEDEEVEEEEYEEEEDNDDAPSKQELTMGGNSVEDAIEL